MKLEPGMRVRCVLGASTFLTIGKEYLIEKVSLRYAWVVDDSGKRGNWLVYRFKPVVRVKAKCVPSLDLILKRSAVAFKPMTPEQQQAMQNAQRESWVRGEKALGL
jgi:hypothetical protein